MSKQHSPSDSQAQGMTSGLTLPSSGHACGMPLKSNVRFMKTLYEASSAVEANDPYLLRQRSDRAHSREASTGAIGELPAEACPSRRDESGLREGSEVVERWDSDQPKRPNQDPLAVAAGSVCVRSVALGVAGSYAFYRSPVTVDGVDYNGDASLTRSGPTPQAEAAEIRG